MPDAIPEQLRLFIAIALPDTIKDELARVQAGLRQAAPRARISWTKPGQFHLTLRFLGNVESSRVESLGAAILAAGKGFGSLILRAEGIGCFPNLRRPRVIWVGLHDSEEMLARLQGAIQDATRDFTGEKPETRFSGHVTLARIKSIAPNEANGLSREILGCEQASWGEWTVEQVELIRSELSPEGARYSRLLEVPLRVFG